MSENNFLNNLFNLEGKSVLITGSMGQLGHAICSAYLNLGCKVIGADVQKNDTYNIENNNFEFIPLDITDDAAVKEQFNLITKKYGQLDVLVNNAGVSCFEPFEERSEESFDWVMGVNLKGTFFCIREFSALAKRLNKPGSIVNIGSHYGMVSPDFRIYTDCARRNSEVYGATKAGIIQMTKYFAVSLAELSIRVNCISPGGIFNPSNPQGEDFVNNYSFRCPLKRMANVEEVIGAVLYVSSDAATYTTGQNIAVDGGVTSW